MTQAITRSVLVPYSTQEMYGLVCDVARYREFLPGCISSERITTENAAPTMNMMKLNTR